jgi:aldose 1-epimerase
MRMYQLHRGKFGLRLSFFPVALCLFPCLAPAFSLFPFASSPSAAQQYTARRVNDVVQLEDAKHQTVVSIMPSIGNQAFEMQVKGHNVLRWTYASIADFQARPGSAGVPFLAPWADRLDEQAFYANGKRYAFDMELGNVRGAMPIHGFLTTAPHWQVAEVKADDKSAWVTSTLDFYRQPAWMKQFPFAHRITMIYRLQEGVLEVDTSIANMSAEPMPVSVGFHPYFKLTDSTRDEWTFSVPAKTHWILAPTKVPTGETEPAERLFPNPQSAALKDYNLDDVFTDLVRDDQGRARAVLQGRKQKLEILLGPNWRGLVVWAPNPSGAGLGSNAFSPNTPARGSAPPAGAAQGASQAGGRGGASRDPDFICFEPLAGIINGLNLAHKGLYKELQYIQPGGTWQASFWIRPSGF